MTREDVLKQLPIRAYFEHALEHSVTWNGSPTTLVTCVFHDDSRPSLSLNSETGDFHCFGCEAKGSIFDFVMLRRGCDFKEALKELADFAGVHEGADVKPKPDIETTYRYTDAKGTLLFEVVRFRPKDFKQRRPDGKGGWVWNMDGIGRVPYNLPEVTKSNYVVIVEGEKDVESLRALGVVATCNPGGVGKWKPEYNKYLQGKHVAILPDHDAPGRKHAVQVASSLNGIAAVIKVVELPGLPDKGDVSDWTKQEGNGKVPLFMAIQSAPNWEPSTDTETYHQASQDVPTDDFPEDVVQEPTPMPTAAQKTVETAEAKPDALKMLRTGAELQTLECTVTWVWDKQIPEQSITLFSGKGGIGKTWLMLGIAEAVSKGLYYLDLPTRKMPVYYIDFENSLPVLVDRVRKLNITDVLFWHSTNEVKPPRIDTPEWERYKTLPPGLIIFDTLRASQGKDENNSADMALVMGRLKELRDLGFTVVLLHHTPKGNDRTYKGSTAIFDLSDHVLGLYRTRKGKPDEVIDDDDNAEDACFRIGTKDKTRYEPFHMFIAFDPEQGFIVAPDPDTDDLIAMRETIANQGRLNQTQVFELVKDTLGIKNKVKVVSLLRKGIGQYWSVHKEARATYYEAVRG